MIVDQEWEESILADVAQRLHVSSRRPSEKMVRQLAFLGRLAIIVDGISERRVDDASQQMKALLAREQARFVIVTSRDGAPPGTEFEEIRIGPLDDDRLKDFACTYLVDMADQAAFEKALRKLIGDESILPLFAHLAIEQYQRDGDLPASYPQLVEEFVRSLGPGGTGALREDDFLRAARIAAYVCVEEELAPRAVATELLRGSFLALETKLRDASKEAKEVAAPTVIDQLVKCGLLEKFTKLAEARVRFTNDPIAEYLMAMHLVASGLPQLFEIERRIAKRSQKAMGLSEAIKRIRGSLEP